MKARRQALALVILCLPLYGFDFYSKLRNEEGNRYYQKGRLGKAKTAYTQALKSEPESKVIAFNLGNTYYKEGAFAESLKNFKNAAGKSSEPDLQAHAFYNIGNALYRQEDMNKAAEFYKQTLRLDPADQDAKYNLELTQRVLEKKKDEPQNKDKKDQQKKENQKQNQKDQNKDQNQNKQDQSQDKQDQKQEPKDGQEKQPKSDQGQSEQKTPQENQNQNEPKEGEAGGTEGQGQDKKDTPEQQGDKESNGGSLPQPPERAGDGQTGPQGEKSFGEAQDQKKPKSDAEARAEQILSALESGEQQTMKMQGSKNGPGPKVRRITEKDW